jgi:hypothetical protein
MANPKYTVEKIKDILITNGKDIVMIGEYTNHRAKTLFRHITCGHEWLTTFEIMGRKSCGCPKCHIESRKISKLEIDRRLRHKNIITIDEYINSHHKIKFKHEDCQYSWYAKPCDLLNGKHGCPKCASHGFDSSQPAWAYIFERDNYIKFGVTNNINQRLISHKRHGELILRYSKFYINGKDARDWEKSVKKEFGGNYVTKKICKDGHTETLTKAILSLLLEKFT